MIFSLISLFCLISEAITAEAKSKCPKISLATNVDVEKLANPTGKVWYTPWVSEGLRANLLKVHFLELIKTNTNGETIEELKAQFPKFWNSYCGNFVFNNHKDTVTMNAFATNSTLSWEVQTPTVALFHNPSHNQMLNAFEGLIRYIVWTDNTTNYLIVFCFPNGVINWVIYSRNKAVTSDVEKIIMPLIKKFPLSPLHNGIVKYAYKNCSI